ncbi:MAG: hypothetical protein WBA88_04140 [Pseudaminobacter sp.]
MAAVLNNLAMVLQRLDGIFSSHVRAGPACGRVSSAQVNFADCNASRTKIRKDRLAGF